MVRPHWSSLRQKLQELPEGGWVKLHIPDGVSEKTFTRYLYRLADDLRIRIYQRVPKVRDGCVYLCRIPESVPE